MHGCDQDTVDVTRRRPGRRLRRGGSAASTSWSTTRAASSGRSAGRSRRSRDADWRAIVDANLTSTFVCTRAVVAGDEGAPATAGSSTSPRAPDAASASPASRPTPARRPGRSASPARPRTSSGRSASPSTASRRASCSRTRRTDRQWESYGEEGQRALLETIATRRLGPPEDIANGVLFFVSEASSGSPGR